MFHKCYSCRKIFQCEKLMPLCGCMTIIKIYGSNQSTTFFFCSNNCKNESIIRKKKCFFYCCN